MKKEDLKPYSIAYKTNKNYFVIETLVNARCPQDAVEQLVKQLKEQNINEFYYDEPRLIEGGEEMKKEDWIVELTESDREEWYVDIECDSREKAITEGRNEALVEGLKSFRIGKMERCEMARIDVNTIIDNAQEEFYAEEGEVAESYLEGVTIEQEEELEEELNKVFYEWHKNHKLFPTCYRILNDEVIKVEDE